MKYKQIYYTIHISAFALLTLSWLCVFISQIILSDMFEHVPFEHYERWLFSWRLLLGGNASEVFFNLFIAPAPLIFYFKIRAKKFIFCYFLSLILILLVCYSGLELSLYAFRGINYKMGGGGCCHRFFFDFTTLIIHTYQIAAALTLHSYLFIKSRPRLSII